MLKRLFWWIVHRLCLHIRRRCEHCKATTWFRGEGINDIHPDGPPLYFELICCSCGKYDYESSGLMENAAGGLIASGQLSEEKAVKTLCKLLPPRVIEAECKRLKACSRRR